MKASEIRELSDKELGKLRDLKAELSTSVSARDQSARQP